ncbi:MAG: hypothetical protein ABGY24_11935 [bacterium]
MAQETARPATTTTQRVRPPPHRVEQNSMPGDGTGAGTDKAAGYTRRRNMKKVRRL